MTTSTLQEAAVARPLPADVALEITRLAEAHPGAVEDVDRILELRPELPATRALAQSVRVSIEKGAGFDVVSAAGLPGELHRLAYAAIGMFVGEPILRYGLLYAVADRGESYLEKQIPVSMTRANTGMHTDSSARDCVPGVVALLCERPSLSGGTSRIADARAACDWLAENEPEALRLLEQPYLRDVVTPGMGKDLETLKKNRFPIVSRGDDFQLRYMRYWVEKGHERAGEPLAPEVLEAMDALDRALARPEFGASFRLEGGDMLFVDNRRLVHGRDAYDAVPDGGRLLWRMWLGEQADEHRNDVVTDRTLAAS
ncbi:MAG: TauD/TfdA family dioxygenase [Planctomycetota bacterium]